jgi:hypothetical protein
MSRVMHGGRVEPENAVERAAQPPVMTKQSRL